MARIAGGILLALLILSLINGVGLMFFRLLFDREPRGPLKLRHEIPEPEQRARAEFLARYGMTPPG